MIQSIKKKKSLKWQYSDFFFFAFEKSSFQEPLEGRCLLHEPESFTLSDLEFIQKLENGGEKLFQIYAMPSGP